jgi:hypothetical protein
VCSFFQAHYNPSFFTIWSPLWSELCAKFFLSGRLFFAQFWFVITRVRKSGVFLLLSSRLILSIFSNNPSTTLCYYYIKFVICAVNFFSFRTRSSVSFLSSLATLAVRLPFEKSGSEFLPVSRRVIFSSVGRYFLLPNF